MKVGYAFRGNWDLSLSHTNFTAAFWTLCNLSMLISGKLVGCHLCNQSGMLQVQAQECVLHSPLTHSVLFLSLCRLNIAVWHLMDMCFFEVLLLVSPCYKEFDAGWWYNTYIVNIYAFCFTFLQLMFQAYNHKSSSSTVQNFEALFVHPVVAVI